MGIAAEPAESTAAACPSSCSRGFPKACAAGSSWSGPESIAAKSARPAAWSSLGRARRNWLSMNSLLEAQPYKSP